jgi:Arc/MetJ-type ribon-helix-helix transcriptional regulator
MNRKRLDGGKKLVHLTRAQEAGIKAYCAEHRVESESEFIRQAVAAYLSRDAADSSLIIDALKRTDKKLSNLEDMLKVTYLYLQKMQVYFFVYHGEIDDEFKEAARESADRRYKKFFDSLQADVRNDAAFFERLLHEYFTEGA